MIIVLCPFSNNEPSNPTFITGWHGRFIFFAKVLTVIFGVSILCITIYTVYRVLFGKELRNGRLARCMVSG